MSYSADQATTMPVLVHSDASDSFIKVRVLFDGFLKSAHFKSSPHLKITPHDIIMIDDNEYDCLS